MTSRKLPAAQSPKRRPRKLIPQTPGAVDKRRRPRGLTPAVRIAIDSLIFDRCSRADACKTAGITERAFYLALEKHEVAAYWNAQLQVLRSGERAANIYALTDVRDGTNAMARVNAVKTLEQAVEIDETRQPGRQMTPGLVIVINGDSAPQIVPPAPRPMRTIEHGAESLSANNHEKHNE